MLQIRQSIGGLGNIMFKQAYIINQVLENNIPDIYLQSEEYWKEHGREIRDFFNAGIGYTDKVAVHIRRGDYLSASHFHTNLHRTPYYKEALRIFPDQKFIVFCKDRQNEKQDAEDRKWCEEFMEDLVPGRWEFAPEGTEVDDMNLMASCKAIIMANSSFSWWAAYLGKEDKSVLCPDEKNWFMDGMVRVKCPERWTRIRL